MIDHDGFRPNVGIILCNTKRRLFWGRRVGQDAWQFPQGGILGQETPEQAMFRELEEEIGLCPRHVELLGCTRQWLHYRLPERLIRRHIYPLCVGQKQLWFLLRVRCPESEFCFDRTLHPEFDDWRWVNYWQPVSEVVYFKRQVYIQALEELAPLLYPEGVPGCLPVVMRDIPPSPIQLESPLSPSLLIQDAPLSSIYPWGDTAPAIPLFP